jgi:hypothetical protein
MSSPASHPLHGDILEPGLAGDSPTTENGPVLLEPMITPSPSSVITNPFDCDSSEQEGVATPATAVDYDIPTLLTYKSAGMLQAALPVGEKQSNPDTVNVEGAFGGFGDVGAMLNRVNGNDSRDRVACCSNGEDVRQTQSTPSGYMSAALGAFIHTPTHTNPDFQAKTLSAFPR